MGNETRLLDLVVRFEELRDAGETIVVEDLCRDCPELVPALNDRLRALGAFDALPMDKPTLSSSQRQETASDSGSGKVDLPVALPGYEIVRELGRGGMGVVYQARQLKLNRLVALKVLPGGRRAKPTAQARFKAEVEAIARLQHPNLIQVFEIGEHKGRTYFSMEYLAGGTLEERIGSQPQPARQAAELIKLLAAAIHAAHQRGVIHRDLKPANILLSEQISLENRTGVPGFGTPKISDFGLAKRLDVPEGPTLTEHILGTPSYMAPEQAMGRSKQVGVATDVYSLGAILYRLLVGRPPFLGESVMDVVRQVTECEPTPPHHLQTGVPLDLETICLKCLQKLPGQRYDSAAQLAEDLHHYLVGEPILARPIGPIGRAAKWARRRPAAACLIAVSSLAAFVLLSGGWWFTRRLAAELDRTRIEQQNAVEARRDLESALAGQIAASLDADFRKLEGVPQSVAALMSQRTKWNEDELEAWITALVRQSRRIFGISVSFEPNQFVGSRVYEDYSLYVYKAEDAIRVRQLLPPDYPPPFYRERDWYKIPKLTGLQSWSEPFVAARAVDTPMLTYSCPFLHRGKFGGVVSADLSIQYFQELHYRLQKQHLGPNSYGFVISPGGTFLYHPNPRFEFPAPASSLDRIDATPDFLFMMREMQDRDAGWAHAIDFDSGQPADFYFARISATGGHFVLVRRADSLSERAPSVDK